MKKSKEIYLNEIPENWDEIKGKYAFKQRTQKGGDALVLLSPTQKYGVIPQELYEKLSGMTAVKINEKTNLSSFKTIKKGDYCISLRSFEGGFEYCIYNGVVSPAYTVFYCVVDGDDVYYKYLFKAWPFIREMNSYSLSLRDGKPISYETFGNTNIPLPPLAEQKAIADFLDKKCGEIDEISKIIENQIDILENYKKSIISEVVTKGLNENVELKSVPIDWAPQIPVHWEYMPNKYIMKKIKNVCAIHSNEDIISLSMNGVIVRDLEAGGKMPTTFNGYQFVYPGNLLMCLFDYDVTPRCIGFINNYGITSPAYSQFVMKNENCAKYYFYYYLMIDNTKELLHLAKNLRHSFTEDELGKIYTIVPPLAEQKAIADFLDKKCGEIDEIIESKRKQLEKIDQYKKSLIYEYVTGKKEVTYE